MKEKELREVRRWIGAELVRRGWVLMGATTAEDWDNPYATCDRFPNVKLAILTAPVEKKYWMVWKDGRQAFGGRGLGMMSVAKYPADVVRPRIIAWCERLEESIRNPAMAMPVDAPMAFWRRPELNGLEVRFAAKPAEEILAGIRAHKFHWYRANKYWWAKYSSERMLFLESVAEQLGGKYLENGRAE